MTLKDISTILLCSGLIFSLQGCGENTAKKAKKAVTNVAKDPGLQGSFKGNCTSMDMDALSNYLDGSSQIMLQFQGSSFTRVHTLYSEENCKSPGIDFVYQGSFKADPEAVQQSAGGALNIQIEKAMVEVKNQDLAETLNSISFCGQNNFQANEKVEIKESNALCPLAEVPKSLYGVYQVKGDDLVLDHANIFDMATSEAERNKELNTDEIYKQD